MLNEIKEYSSKFATKMNYILDLMSITPIQYGRAKAIEGITKEKDTTINNWLFNGRYPRENKKLGISDAIGVSYNYLFNDTINVANIIKPEIFRDNQCYLIPFINENEIFSLKNNRIFPIKSRLPIMFPSFDMFIKKYGTNIYMTRINQGVFESYVKPNSDIIYSENVIFENFRLVIHNDHKSKELTIKRIIQENSNFFIEYFNKKNMLIKEPLDISSIDDYVSVILSFSK